MWGAIAAAGASILGSVMNYNSVNRANSSNVNLNKENRAWQEYMSNTAVRRHAADLEAAGFNRLLAATGQGSSTPSGSVANVKAPEVTPLDVLAIQQARANVDKTKAETAVNLATVKNVKEQNLNLAAQRANLRTQNTVFERQAEKYLVDQGLTRAQARKALYEGDNIWYELSGKKRAGSYGSESLLMRDIKSIIRMFRDGDINYREYYYPENNMSRLPPDWQW